LVSLIFLIQCTTISNKTESSVPTRALNADITRQDFKASGKRYALSTQGRHTTRIAAEILKQGGNLIDAAIAASFAISVERPQSTGLGGGGFLIYHEAKTGKVYALDFRERAPLKSSEKMFLNAKGQPDNSKSQDSIFATATPGLVRGLSEIHKKFGTLPFSKLVEPAAQLAEQGFEVYSEFFEALKDRHKILQKNPASRAIFLTPQGDPLPLGFKLVQKDLAMTLRILAKEGPQAFYEGSIAKKIIQYSKSQNGILSAEDLKSYQVHWRDPLKGSFKGYDVFSMPPPSSGGVHVLQFLNMLEKDELAKSGFLSTRALHLEASAMQSAFADRAQYLGDPDFVKVPVEGLLDKNYALKRRREFDERAARSAHAVQAGHPMGYESSDTTHFSMMDSEGNAVSSTQTINGWMGSGHVVPGTGIVLNNEMDDFSAQVGAQNMFGAVGSKANAVAPKKTPLSSMSPTILVKNQKPVLAVGAPGGTRIISCVAQTIFNVIEFGLPLDQAISSVRLHQQWRPDRLLIEPPGPNPQVLEELKAMGHNIELKPVGCKVMAVQNENGALKAVSDPRDIGAAWGE
ncbi:MAG: gamma-glutamyltransferase, partial [Pseudobdellovibrionaceae bacterium]